MRSCFPPPPTIKHTKLMICSPFRVFVKMFPTLLSLNSPPGLSPPPPPPLPGWRYEVGLSPLTPRRPGPRPAKTPHKRNPIPRNSFPFSLPASPKHAGPPPPPPLLSRIARGGRSPAIPPIPPFPLAFPPFRSLFLLTLPSPCPRPGTAPPVPNEPPVGPAKFSISPHPTHPHWRSPPGVRHRRALRSPSNGQVVRDAWWGGAPEPGPGPRHHQQAPFYFPPPFPFAHSGVNRYHPTPGTNFPVPPMGPPVSQPKKHQGVLWAPPYIGPGPFPGKTWGLGSEAFRSPTIFIEMPMPWPMKIPAINRPFLVFSPLFLTSGTR